MLLVDEMKIKSGLVFNKNSGKLVGFSNLSQVNQDINEVASRLQLDSSVYTPPLAKKMLTFMIRPMYKPSLAFAIAAYPSTEANFIQ